MSANAYELAEQVYALPPYERRIFYDELLRLDPMLTDLLAAEEPADEHGMEK